MTVSTSTNRIQYTGNAVITTFPYTFRIFNDTDLTVLSLTAGVETTETEYTVTGAGDEGGGNVVFTTAPATGTTITIIRIVPETQETDYVENDPFPAASHEDALDKLTMIDIQQSEELDRTIKVKKSSAYTDLEIPDPVASKTIQWKTDLSGFENVDSPAVAQAAAAASAAAALVSQSAAAVSAAAALVSQGAASSSAASALSSKNAAETAETNAETAETNAETAETNAETAETNAAASATTASGHSVDAQGYSSDASDYADASAASALESSGFATTASGHMVDAETAQTAAELAETGAEGFATTASGHAVDAAASAVDSATYSLRAQVNLIRNPFGAMSQGTQEDQYGATSLITGTDSDMSGANNWTKPAGWSITGGVMRANSASGNNDLYVSNCSVGRIYTFRIEMPAYTSGTFSIRIVGAGSVVIAHSEDITSAATQTITFKADSALMVMRITYTSGTPIADFDNATLIEQTRACVAADGKCFDGWSKDSTADVYRGVAKDYFTGSKEHSCAIIIPTTAGDYVIYEKLDNALDMKRLEGSFMVMQARLVSDTADEIFIRFQDGTQTIDSGYHSGGGAEEVLEIAFTVGVGATVFRPSIRFVDGDGVHKVTDFMLSFGSYIGEGNYVPPPPHSVYPEVAIYLKTYGDGSAATGFSDQTDTQEDIEVQTEMAVPGNAVAIGLACQARDSASLANSTWIAFSPIAGLVAATPFSIRNGGIANDFWMSGNGDLMLVDGAFYVSINASGAGTLDTVGALVSRIGLP